MAYDEYSHYAMSRTSLWCPICGAAENKGSGSKGAAHTCSPALVERETAFLADLPCERDGGRS